MRYVILRRVVSSGEVVILGKTACKDDAVKVRDGLRREEVGNEFYILERNEKSGKFQRMEGLKSMSLKDWQRHLCGREGQ